MSEAPAMRELLGLADGRMAMVGFGLNDAFWLTPLTSPLGLPRWSAIGLEDFSTRYFAVRSAPLGGGPNELVSSAFFGWHPSKIDRYLAAAWARTDPREVLQTVQEVADEVLRAALGGWVHTDDAAQAAEMLRTAAELRKDSIAGRPLFAGYAALAWPDPAAHHLTLWHAATLLREFRGDSHNALLVSHGIDACECHLLLAAAVVGGCECHAAFAAFGVRVDVSSPPDPANVADREWPAQERQDALDRLADRGLLTPDGAITGQGMTLHEEIERATDRISALPTRRGTEDVERYIELVADPLRRLRSSGAGGDIGELVSPD
jgi:hypothetical protein